MKNCDEALKMMSIAKRTRRNRGQENMLIGIIHQRESRLTHRTCAIVHSDPSQVVAHQCELVSLILIRLLPALQCEIQNDALPAAILLRLLLINVIVVSSALNSYHTLCVFRIPACRKGNKEAWHD